MGTCVGSCFFTLLAQSTFSTLSIALGPFKETNSSTCTLPEPYHNANLYSCRTKGRSFPLVLQEQPVPPGHVITKVELATKSASMLIKTMKRQGPVTISLDLVRFCIDLLTSKEINGEKVGNCQIPNSAFPQCQHYTNCTLWNSDVPYFQFWNYGDHESNQIYLTVETEEANATVCLSDPTTLILTVASGVFQLFTSYRMLLDLVFQTHVFLVSTSLYLVFLSLCSNYMLILCSESPL